MINITNKRARRLYLAEMTRQMMRLETTQAREIKPILNRQYMSAAQLVQQGALDSTGLAVDRERPRLAALMTKHYRRTATVFSNKVFRIVNASKSVVAPEIKGPKEEFWSELNLWMTSQAGKKITKIQDTSKKLIAGVVQKGMQEGESHLEIAKRVRATGKIATPHRARTIAITETHTAACKSVDAAIRSTRIEMEKEWLATMDKRTRPDHLAMSEHPRVLEGGKFKVGMASMEYPGDPAGGADQTVRCRCILLYHTVKRMDEVKPYTPSKLPESEWVGSLSDGEKDAIRSYGAGSYDDMRKFQKTGKGSKEVRKKVELVEQALDRAEPYKGEVYRSLYGLDDVAFDKIVSSKELKWDALSSSTRSRKFAERRLTYSGESKTKSVLFNIKNKSGINIEKVVFDAFREEKEVLMRMGARYKVNSVRKFIYTDSFDGSKYEVAEVFLKEI